jgi:hypothetical protein
MKTAGIMLNRGDLVRTSDGYYGIVLEVRVVLLGNGLEQVLDEQEWAACVAMPITPYETNGPTANFLEMLDGRTPTQQARKRREDIADARWSQHDAAE